VASLPPGTPLTLDWTEIGTVTAGTGVTVDGRPWLDGAGGWDHFR
jgi:thiamine-monophosphate kinase